MSNETINKVKNNNFSIKKVNKEEYSSSKDYSINNQSNENININTNTETEEYDISASNSNSSIEYHNISDYTNGEDFSPNLVLEKYRIYSVDGIYENLSDWWSNVIKKFGMKSKQVKALEILSNNGITLEDISKIKSVINNKDGSMIIKLGNDCTISINPDGSISSINTPEAFYLYENKQIKAINFKNGLNINYKNNHIKTTNYYSNYDYNNNTIKYRNRMNFTPTKILANNNIYSDPGIIENISDWWDDIKSKLGIESKELKALEQLKKAGVYINDVNKIRNVGKAPDGSTYVYLENDCTIRITSSGSIDYIETPEANYGYYDNGFISYINFKKETTDNLMITYDKEGNIISGKFEGDACVDIYGDYNYENLQFGGSQMDFSYNVYELLNDPLIINRLKEYYPDATMEDYEMYLRKICNIGCGYTAMINTIFKEYEGREKEFLDKFGFPMYYVDENGNIDYNYEYLILDYFNYVWGNSGYSIEELYGKIDKNTTDGALGGKVEGKASGTDKNRYELFEKFMNEKYGISCQVNAENMWNATKDNYLDIYNQLKIDDNTQIILSASGAYIYPKDGGKEQRPGSHAMYITGVDDNGNLIVSSWGKEYTVDLSRLDEQFLDSNGNNKFTGCGFTTVTYN